MGPRLRKDDRRWCLAFRLHDLAEWCNHAPLPFPFAALISATRSFGISGT
jgi:hypothetical protein